MQPIFERALALRNSPNATERDSLFLGTLVADGSPLLPHVQTLLGHMYLRGSPGSGKTSTLSYVCELLLSRGPCGMQVFDVKDPPTREMFAGLQIGAARSGVRVRWFVDEVGRTTHTFNLFLQKFWKRLTPLQKAALVGVALGVVHKLEGYGKQVYGGVSFAILLAIFRHWEIGSWKELHERVKHVARNPSAFGLDRFTGQSATQLRNDVERLAQIRPLNTEHSSIDLCSPEPQVIYWSFPGAYDMSGAICRMALFASFEAARDASPDVRQWIVVDEFQRCIGNQIELLFQQSRDKFGLLLANQCLADLETREKDYAPVVQSCCRVHWTFNASDPAEQKFMAESSGKVVRKRITNTYSVGPLGLSSDRTRSYAEVEADRYGLNDVKLVSATPELSLFVCTQDYGFTQFGGFPQAVRTEFHIGRSEHARRKALPWPGPEEGTITGEMPPLLPPPGPKPPKPPNLVNPEPRKPPRRKH